MKRRQQLTFIVLALMIQIMCCFRSLLASVDGEGRVFCNTNQSRCSLGCDCKRIRTLQPSDPTICECCRDVCNVPLPKVKRENPARGHLINLNSDLISRLGLANGRALNLDLPGVAFLDLTG